MEMLIIGCGNADRGDDAAGVLVVRRLRELGIPAVERSGEALELIETWSGDNAGRAVILIDAVITGATPGTIQVWDARAAPVTREAFRCSTHSLGVAEAIELARAMDLLPAALRIYGIEAARFEAGAEPCVEVQRAAAEVADRIAREVSCWYARTGAGAEHPGDQ